MLKLKYTDELGEKFIQWKAAQALKERHGEPIDFREWVREVDAIMLAITFSRISRKGFIMKNYPHLWKEFLKMEEDKLKAEAKKSVREAEDKQTLDNSNPA